MAISTENKVWTDAEFMALTDEKYVLVYHSPEPDRFLRSGDGLDGEAIVPGFSVAISELFEEWDF